MQYASAGVGSFMHLGGELFKLTAGVDMLHVPFKGGGPAMIDLIGGHTKVGFATHHHDGAACPLGQAQGARRRRTTRSPVLPEVPTIAEAGVPGYEAPIGSASWRRPARPQHRRKAAQGDLGDPGLPEVQKQLAAQGAETCG